MRSLFIIFLIVFLMSCSDKNERHELLMFELRLAQTEPDPALTVMSFNDSGKKFFIHNSVYLSNIDIVNTEVIDRQTQPKVRVTLNEAGAKKFADFTKGNVGRHAAMIVDNKLVSAPRINAQITQGILLIIGPFDYEEAKNMAEGILPD